MGCLMTGKVGKKYSALDGEVDNFSVTVVPVPEPATDTLFVALLPLAVVARRHSVSA